MLRRSTIAALTLTATVGLGLPLLPASAADATGSISGVAFEDSNRNGVRDAGEAPRAGDQLYLFDGSSTYVAGGVTDSVGRYSFAGLAAGTYRVEYASDTYWPIRADWVPTTTGSLRPALSVSAPTSSADFGWRRIVRSTDVNAPVSTYTGAEGLRVDSYNDVVAATELYDVLRRGTVGREASSVRVLFGLGSSSTTSTAASSSASGYDAFAASVYATWLSWLDTGDQTLSHEYGHAWSLYHAYLVQQDPSLADYLRARGLTGDPRLGTSHGWDAREFLAEDYRQLLGSPSAAAGAQMNSDVPPAASVPGLREYLSTTFSTGPTTGPTSTASPSPTRPPSPSASPSASTSPRATASASATASPSPTTSASATASPSPTALPSPSASPKVRGGGGCGKRC